MQGGGGTNRYPDEIPNNPANDYVRTFFRGVDIELMYLARDINKRRPETLPYIAPGLWSPFSIKVLEDEDRNFGYLIERGRKFVQVLFRHFLEEVLES